MGLLFYHKFQWEFNRCASFATRSTSTMLYNEGTENGAEAMVDEIQMRSKAVVSGIPITTTIAALTSTVEGLMDKHDYGRFEICSLQEYHRHIVK